MTKFKFKQDEDCAVPGSTSFAMIPVKEDCDMDGFAKFFPPNCPKADLLWDVYSDKLGSTANNKKRMERTAQEAIDALCPGVTQTGDTDDPIKTELQELQRQRAEAEKSFLETVRQVHAAEEMVTDQHPRADAATKALAEAEENLRKRMSRYGDATRVRSSLDGSVAELERLS